MTTLHTHHRPTHVALGAALAFAACFFASAHAFANPSPHVVIDTDLLWPNTVKFFTLHYDYLRSMILGSILVGATCGLLGVFLVLRRLSLMGDALGHASLPGVALAFMIVQSKAIGPLFFGATITALLGAFTVGYITRNSKTRPDAALGVVLSGFFGVGVLLLSIVQNDPSAAQSGLQDFLFGNAAAIRPEEVTVLAVLFATTLSLITLFYRPLLLLTFDSTFAASTGVPTRALHYGLMALASVAVVASMQSVGVVLVAAMLIIPASTARLLTHRFHVVLLLSTLLGAVAGLLGSWISFLASGFSSGPCMVLVAALMYTLAFLFGPAHGVIPTRLRSSKRSQTPPSPETSHPSRTNLIPNTEAHT